MGTREEEALARQEQQQRETQARLDFIRRQQEMAERQRLQEEADRKAAEDKLVNGTGSGNMVADEPATANWPDDGFQGAAPGRLDGVKGALGIGGAGDAALASRLLNDGRPPAADAVAGRPGAEGGGIKERLGTALGAGVAKPAVER
jgi:hypothetical protein